MSSLPRPSCLTPLEWRKYFCKAFLWRLVPTLFSRVVARKAESKEFTSATDPQKILNLEPQGTAALRNSGGEYFALHLISHDNEKPAYTSLCNLLNHFCDYGRGPSKSAFLGSIVHLEKLHMEFVQQRRKVTHFAFCWCGVSYAFCAYGLCVTPLEWRLSFCKAFGC